MGLAFFAERLGGCVEGAKDSSDVASRHAERGKLTRYRSSVRALGRPKAAVAAAAIGRADRAAAGLGDGTEAGCSLRHHNADGASQFAFVAYTVTGDRRLAPDQKSLDDLEQLTLVDRTAAQLKIDRHVS